MISKFIINLVLLVCSEAYNVDVEHPITLPSPTPGSYFGYTTVFLSNAQGKWVLVGAPKGNATSLSRKSFKEPGEIYKCNIDTITCSPLELDSGKEDKPYRKENGWLGVSLDISPSAKQLVACAHLVKDGNYWPVGLCYAANANDISSAMGIKVSLAHQTGLSAHFVKDSSSLLIGWSGPPGKVKYFENVQVPAGDKIFPNTYYAHYPESYDGYALTSGKFSKNHQMQFVSGAPRKNYKGEVNIQDIPNGPMTTLSGEKMGDYFGAALCAVDLNNDGLDDLLVGAPFYSNDLEEGKVYVYTSKQNNIFVKSQKIVGSAVSARFGSSIAAIGDINFDDYKDVAIGAPYENDNRGAVYIYNGNSDGLDTSDRQRIEASSSQTRAFGISISGGIDVDGNNYNDIAIGAYISDEVFIYKTRPIVKVDATLSVNQNLVEVGSPVQLQVCFNISGKHLPDPINIGQSVTVDASRGDDISSSRVLFDNNQKTAISEFYLQTGQQKCEQYIIYAPKAPSDYFTPIVIKLSYNLGKVLPTCTDCPSPMLEPKSSNVITEEIWFKTGCGTAKCSSDLKVNARISDLGEGNPLVIGSTAELELRIEVSNDGDAAYGTRLTIVTPSWMAVDNIPPTCSLKSEELECDVANPLESEKNIAMKFNLNIRKMPVREEDLVINCTATCQSDETNTMDNSVLLKIPTKMVADIFVLGSTSQEQIFYDRNNMKIEQGATVNFSHVYEVHNAGPTALDEIEIEIFYPESLDGGESIMQIALKKGDVRDGKVPTFGKCTGNYLTMDEIAKLQTKGDSQPKAHTSKRDSGSEPHDGKTYLSNGTQAALGAAPAHVAILDCSTAICKSVSCTVGPFGKDARATLSMLMIVSITDIHSFMGNRDAAVVVTIGRVKIPLDIQPTEHTSDSIQVMTEIKPGGAPPPEPPALWVILVGVLGGILLLAVLILLLYKKGFFKRTWKEEMKKMARQTLVLNEGMGAETDEECKSKY